MPEGKELGKKGKKMAIRKRDNEIYQFKITLQGSKPPIWRRFIVPGNYRFWDLHLAIQDAMGWEDCHLHLFTMYSPRQKREANIGIPEEDEYLKSTKEFIKDYFSLQNPSAAYVYDFGDGWRHKLTLEKISTEKEDESYPQCTGGKNACPPENSGGLEMYYQYLSIFNNPLVEGHAEVKAWLGEDFDPEAFDPEEVEFQDPVARQKEVGL